MARVKKKNPVKRARKKNFTLEAVGLQHRVILQTRRMMKRHLPFIVAVEREPDNNKDPNALKVVIADETIPYDGFHIGYLRKEVAAVWGPAIDEGRLTIVRAYALEMDEDCATAELKVTVEGNTKSLEIGT